MRRIFKYLLFFIIAFVVGMLYSQIRSPITHQLIKFNHKKHAIENEIECTFCHKGAKEGKYATLPSVNICIECHEEAITESKEEEGGKK